MMAVTAVGCVHHLDDTLSLCVVALGTTECLEEYTGLAKLVVSR